MMNKKQDTLLMPEDLRLGTTPKTSGLRATISQNLNAAKKDMKNITPTLPSPKL
jgi:hypothetical protein